MCCNVWLNCDLKTCLKLVYNNFCIFYQTIVLWNIFVIHPKLTGFLMIYCNAHKPSTQHRYRSNCWIYSYWYSSPYVAPLEWQLQPRPCLCVSWLTVGCKDSRCGNVSSLPQRMSLEHLFVLQQSALSPPLHSTQAPAKRNIKENQCRTRPNLG